MEKRKEKSVAFKCKAVEKIAATESTNVCSVFIMISFETQHTIGKSEIHHTAQCLNIRLIFKELVFSPFD